MINILLADDHKLVIDGIRLMLENEVDLQCIAEANNGQEVLIILEKEAVDVILLDINMPILNGLEAMKKIRQQFPAVKVLALSMLQEVALIKKMIKNGADGYLLKNAGKEEVIHAIREVQQGRKYYSSEVSAIIMDSLSERKKQIAKSPFPKLSRREKQVMQLIIDEYTTQEIADKLFISIGTVETHRRNMLIKLGARNSIGLVRICLEYGLLE